MEENVDQQQMLVTDASTQGASKTWGFRRSTIARREFMEEIGSLDASSVTSRRSTRSGRGKGRGRGRGKQVCDTSTTPAPKRVRGGRKAGLVDLAQALSPNPVGAGVPSALGAADCIEAEVKPQGGDDTLPQLATSDAEAPVSDQAEDSDELTLRELQERARKQRGLEEVDGGAAARADTVNSVKEDTEEKPEQNHQLRSEENLVSEEQTPRKDQMAAVPSHHAQGAALRSGQGTVGGSRSENQVAQEEKQEKETKEVLDDDNGEEDPNALYCICRQRHNNRFMICCDRCQEWFHGDCVGITSARGRLLEENGEDYICPSCSPCQSPADAMKQPAFPSVAASPSSESLPPGLAAGDRLCQDEGIKGKIRKTSHHSTKRKIKIFQSVEIVAAMSEDEKRRPPPQEEGLIGKSAAIPKCIGPGCANHALPESVYCGHQCIIRHAAMTMQSLSEPRAQPEVQATKPAAPKPLPKIQKSFLEKLFRRKPVVKPAQEDDAGGGGGDDRSEESAGTVEKAEPITSPLSSDPGRQATGAEPSSAITSSVFYQSSMYHSGVTVCVDSAHLCPTVPQHFKPTLCPPIPAHLGDVSLLSIWAIFKHLDKTKQHKITEAKLKNKVFIKKNHPQTGKYTNI
uniref:PHD-type domain-containing protein n=1 Tax=Electrophorus electricus TaxID=8005 RepID=A0A4W4FTI3_ELEEL